jgi:hypothetical protein
MKRSRFVILTLIAVLVASNGWWAYSSIDAGVSYTDLGESERVAAEGLKEAMAVINAQALPDAGRDQIIDAAKRAGDVSSVYEKGGYVWVGVIGLRFDSSGRLTQATDHEE